MITENISNLQIHRLTQEQYNRELKAGNIDANALYLTPVGDIDVDLSNYYTKEEIDEIVGDIGSALNTVITEQESIIAMMDGFIGGESV